MQYPSCVHRDGDTGFRASFPNFPGAAAHGNSMDELKVDAQEAVELAYDRSEQLIPAQHVARQSYMPTKWTTGKESGCLSTLILHGFTSQAIGIQVNLLETLLLQVDLAIWRQKNVT